MFSHMMSYFSFVSKIWTFESLGVHILYAIGGSIIYSLLLISYRIWLHPLAKVPGPTSYAALDIFNQWSSNISGTFVRRAAHLHRQYGSTVRIGPNRVAIDGSIGFPEVYALRTKSKLEFPKVSNYVFPGAELTIVGSNNEDHRRLRRHLSHAFSDAALREQEDIISKYVNVLIQQLSIRSRTGEAVNIVKWLNYTMFDIIGDLVYSDSFHSLSSGKTHPFIENFFVGITGNGYSRFLRAYPSLKFLFTLIVGPQQLKKALRSSLHLREMSTEKTETRMQKGLVVKDGHRDFMTYMLRETRDGSNGMTEHDVKVNSSVLVGAGSETTASALSFFFFIAGLNIAQKELLIAEIRSTFTDEDQINIASTGQLEYLQACIEETLRMFPPVPETPPRISPGAEIDGHYLPAGTIIHVYPWATFRNPKNFTDPDSFRPERWLSPSHSHYNARYAHDNRACLKPFSYGPRDCIGKNLAYAEMRFTLSRLLYRFNFELLPGQEEWHNVQATYGIWDKSPLKLNFSQRSF